MNTIINEALINEIAGLKEGNRHLNNRINKLEDTITYLLKKEKRQEKEFDNKV